MRPNKRNYYLNLAAQVATRSTCLIIHLGAIAVSPEGVILSTGYNGPARGSVNCLDKGFCIKRYFEEEPNVYRYCLAVHAEENVVINAARSGVSLLDSIFYLSAQPQTIKVANHTKRIYKYQTLQPKELVGYWFDHGPCIRCRRLLINAGIRSVITPSKTWSHYDLLKLDLNWFKETFTKANKIKLGDNNG